MQEIRKECFKSAEGQQVRLKELRGDINEYVDERVDTFAKALVKLMTGKDVNVSLLYIDNKNPEIVEFLQSMEDSIVRKFKDMRAEEIMEFNSITQRMFLELEPVSSLAIIRLRKMDSQIDAIDECPFSKYFELWLEARDINKKKSEEKHRELQRENREKTRKTYEDLKKEMEKSVNP